ncbi:BatD family protein [Tautonia sociabilis]|uniref:BatD family protein n=1 Tax=Tautonia sociabilis TaxID=2080755 RepID=UPI0013155C34|nr:BatD family protein [Tautonia sociabilis]
MVAALVVIGVTTASALSRQAEPLPVRVEGPPAGPHSVGQAIPIRVLVSAGATEPEVRPPEHPQVDVIPTGRQVRPISASAIGAIVVESNLYRFEYVLIPKVPGPLLVPAFRVTADGRSGATGPIRLDPKPPPASGRPPWFLGGVGPLEVTLAARPEAIQLGDSSSVDVTLTGPGAFGSTIRPALRGADGAPLDATVEPLEETRVEWPPSRTFPFRVRPRTPGAIAIAPVLVSWFDPASGGYRTVGSDGLTIRVVDPPRFDPEAVEVAAIPGAEEDGPRRSRWPEGPAAVLGGVSALAVIVIVLARSWSRSRRRSARRYALLQARALSRCSGVVRAERAAEALAGYLRRAIGRPEGELTPEEAASAVIEATGDPALGDRASAIVEQGDALRFSGRSEIDGGTPALDDAPGFFRALAHDLRPAPERSARSGADPRRGGG